MSANPPKYTPVPSVDAAEQTIMKGENVDSEEKAVLVAETPEYYPQYSRTHKCAGRRHCKTLWAVLLGLLVTLTGVGMMVAVSRGMCPVSMVKDVLRHHHAHKAPVEDSTLVHPAGLTMDGHASGIIAPNQANLPLLNQLISQLPSHIQRELDMIVVDNQEHPASPADLQKLFLAKLKALKDAGVKFDEANMAVIKEDPKHPFTAEQVRTLGMKAIDAAKHAREVIESRLGDAQKHMRDMMLRAKNLLQNMFGNHSTHEKTA